jgi:hypothetical protein
MTYSLMLKAAELYMTGKVALCISLVVLCISSFNTHVIAPQCCLSWPVLLQFGTYITCSLVSIITGTLILSTAVGS